MSAPGRIIRGSLTVTEEGSEMEKDLREFVKNALGDFDKYNNIPGLECELLGHHLKNLKSFLHRFDKDLIADKFIKCSNPGIEPPSDELASEQKNTRLDIDVCIRRELARFPKLYFFRAYV